MEIERLRFLFVNLENRFLRYGVNDSSRLSGLLRKPDTHHELRFESQA